MKKFLCVLLSVIICTAFWGCSNQNIQQETSAKTAISEKGSETTAQNSTTKKEERTTNVQKSTATSTTKGNAEKTTAVTAKANPESTAEKKTQAAEKTTAQKTTAKKSTLTKTTTTAKSSTTATTQKKTTTAIKTTTQSAIECSVTIECKSVLDNLDNLKAGHEAYVPSNGIMLSSYTVKVDEGATVYDAVSTACEKNGIKISVKSNPYGKYITGFNNIDEKDCTAQSGWTYQVNGTSPSKSCDKYTISNKDTIVFSYICSY